MTVMLVSIRNRHLQINYVKLDIALVFVFEKKTQKLSIEKER